MLELTIDDIDLLELQRPPNVSLRATISLARALLAIRPKLGHPPHELAASELAKGLEAAEQALTARRRQSSEAESESSLREFDRSVDGVWKMTHDGLERWLNFQTPGFDAFTEAERSAIDLVGKREQAAQAASLRARLFGGGLDFLRTGSVEQSAAMAERLRLVKADGLGEQLDELVGFDITNALMICQGRYEQLVAARLAKGVVGPNLVDVRTRLRRQLMHYSASLVLYLMTKGDTETVRVSSMPCARRSPCVRSSKAGHPARGWMKPTCSNHPSPTRVHPRSPLRLRLPDRIRARRGFRGSESAKTSTGIDLGARPAKRSRWVIEHAAHSARKRMSGLRFRGVEARKRTSGLLFRGAEARKRTSGLVSVGSRRENIQRGHYSVGVEAPKSTSGVLLRGDETQTKHMASVGNCNAR